ncbi:ATP-dependent helicase [Butyrivibrio sp.]|uniref:ATP-dependent helicase n=1 Tax=Butyrivibrio sp. TaxID=28121 RepID=UPI0025BA7043|nr:ATP-dependent helicase [Butyrivibrio sp.]
MAWSFSTVTNANLCHKNREFNFEVTDTNLPENYYRKALIMDCIKAALQWGERRSDAIMNYLNSRYDECGYKNFQQRQMNLAWDHKRVMRYLNNETRTPVFLEGGQVQLGDQMFKVHPDACFIDESDPNNRKIELVRYQLGRPYLTNKGKKNATIRDLKLFSMIMYGRQLGFQEITASIYYLQKTTDVSNGMAGQNFDPDFFEGGGNIVSMTDQYTGVANNLDQQVEDALAKLSDGIDASAMREEDCKKCPKYDICQYTMPPVKLIEEEKSVKDISHLQLTKDQQAAVNVTQGIWRINAGAGAGKTMVVSLRTSQLLNQGVKPEEILMITFTNAGAKEMYERIQLCHEKFGVDKTLDLSQMTICTFNSFGDLVIGDNYAYLGFTKKPKIIDDVERFSIIARILNAHPIAEWTGESFLHFNSTQKNAKGALAITGDIFRIIKQSGKDPATVTPGDVSAATYNCDVPSTAVQAVINLYPIFDAELKKNNLIEYIDQEVLPFKIFNEIDPDYLQNRFAFKHIIVDEFQDSNEGQIELIKILRKLPTFQSLMVVGDDSQAIFGFRDTSPEYIIHFDEKMGEPVNDIYLVENHRSTPQIIDFANKINALNTERVEKDLVATRPSGKPVSIQCFYSKEDEYKFIVEGIKDHLAAGVKPESIAVIAYTKSELQALADILTKEKIPSVMAAPEKLMTNSRIRAILAFGRVLCDIKNTKDALICANAMVGGMIMELPNDRIQQLVDNVILRAETIINASSLQAKKEGFISFIDAIAMDDETVENFKESLANKDYGEILQYCADFALYGADVEYRRLNNYPGVVLSTAHSSKGLEWPVVYNTLSRYQTNSKVYEETRRLVFVSATRARDELYISGVYAAFGKTYETRIYNQYLKECCEVLGVGFEPVYAN